MCCHTVRGRKSPGPSLFSLTLTPPFTPCKLLLLMHSPWEVQAGRLLILSYKLGLIFHVLVSVLIGVEWNGTFFLFPGNTWIPATFGKNSSRLRFELEYYAGRRFCSCLCDICSKWDNTSIYGNMFQFTVSGAQGAKSTRTNLLLILSIPSCWLLCCSSELMVAI